MVGDREKFFYYPEEDTIKNIVYSDSTDSNDN